MTLTLPGYEVVAPYVYSKDIEVETQDGRRTVKELILVTRYTAASEQEIVDGMRKAAARVGGAGPITGSPLEKALELLPPDILREIANGNEELLDNIRYNTSAPVVPEGEAVPEYLEFRNGILQPDAIEDGKAALDLSVPEMYDMLFRLPLFTQNGQGQVGHIRIRLYDGVLPDWEIMEVLLDEESRLTRSLIVEGMFEPDEVSVAVRALYDHPEIKDVLDVSEMQRLEYVASPIAAIAAESETSIDLMAIVASEVARGVPGPFGGWMPLGGIS